MAYLYTDVLNQKLKCKYHYQTKEEAIFHASDIANELSKHGCYEIAILIKESPDFIPMWQVEGIGLNMRYETEADKIGRSRPERS